MKKIYYTFFYFILLGLPAFIFSRFVRVSIKALISTICISILLGLILEIWAVRHGKKDKSFVWDYSNKFTLGPKIFDVPVEDSIIFLILTPIFIIYFYEFVNKFL